jgi:flagellar P-ring protein precursor FlgI
MTALLATASAAAQVRVQDVGRLQGQRTNPLMGYGLVVGLSGTGDGGKAATTMRALVAMHQRFSQEVLRFEELRGNQSVALVVVEAVIPEFGAREGQTLDVRVSTIGEAKSLRGGRLLTTPLQYAMFDAMRPETQRVHALAGGNVELDGPQTPTVGLVRNGAVLESDFYYHFVVDGAVTLVLHDTQAGWPMAHAVARAINHQLQRPADADASRRRERATRTVIGADAAVALGPKNVRVTLPAAERANPAGFITRVLETPIFAMPEQPARVVINRGDKEVSISGTVTVSPTILFVPGLGSIVIGGDADGDSQPATEPNAPPARVVTLEELMRTLSRLAVPPEQVVKAVEHLHRSGHLHGQLLYRE